MPRRCNKYDFVEDYGIGYASNTNEKFYFDIDKYDLIKEHIWRIQTDQRNGYKRVVTTIHLNNGKVKVVTLWKMITGYDYCDHKNGNTLDNRSDNLRNSNHKLNMQNKKKYDNNTSGFMGVSKARNGNWIAAIKKDTIEYNLGAFHNKQDAILARVKAEAAIFDKDYAPHRDLFDVYNIDIEYEKKHWEWWLLQDNVNFLGMPIYKQQRIVIQLTMDEQYVSSYDSIIEASRLTGVGTSGISKCCRKVSVYAGNYKWMYKEDWDELQLTIQN